MSNVQPYDLTVQAVEDLQGIYDYTLQEYGIKQAAMYLTQLKEGMIILSENMKLGIVPNEIRKGLRSFTKDKHVIFYRIVKKRIRIVRVLHGNMDILANKFTG